MIILTHGDLKPRKFIYEKCRSEFIADCSEYSKLFKDFEVSCPECHHSNYVSHAPLCDKPLPKNCISCSGLTHCIEVIDSKELTLPRCAYFEYLINWRSENEYAKSI